MFKRSTEMQNAYRKKLSGMTDEEISNYKLSDNPLVLKTKFKSIVENEFPYEGFSKHHMLVENKEIDFKGMSEGELERYIEDNYDYIMTNTASQKSVKNVGHKHLLKL